MSDPERWFVADGPSRRWISGRGGAAPAKGLALLSKGRGKKNRMASLGRLAGSGIDQVDAEGLLGKLCDAGLVSIHERKNRKGDFEPYEWQLTEAGEQLCQTDDRSMENEAAAYLAGASDIDVRHPVLKAISHWLAKKPISRRPPTLLGIVLAIGGSLRSGIPLQGRLLSLQVQGHTKSIRLEDFREELEELLGCPLENVVRILGRSVLVFGPFRFSIMGRIIDGEWSVPWLALTQETVENLSELEVEAMRLITVENQTAFEEMVREGLPPGAVALYTGGFPGALEKRVIAMLIEAGVEQADHWGDLDLGGLRILRNLQESVPISVRPYRMEPELLHRLPTQPLTDQDIASLRAWLVDPDAPCKGLALAMLETGKKAEQEGWFLANGAPSRV